MQLGVVRFQDPNGQRAEQPVHPRRLCFSTDSTGADIAAQLPDPPDGLHEVIWIDVRGQITARLVLSAAGQVTGETSFGPVSDLHLGQDCEAKISTDGHIVVRGTILCAWGRVDGELMIDGPDARQAGEIKFGVMDATFDASIRYSLALGVHQPPDKVRIYPFPAGPGEAEVRLIPNAPLRTQIDLRTPIAVPALFSTPLGETVALQATPGKAGFATAWDPVNGIYYQTPSGNWEFVTSAAYTDVLLGLSGSEFAQLPPSAAITFLPGGDALVTEDGGFSNMWNGNAVTTAWAYLTASTSLANAYFSQSITQPFFTSDGAGAMATVPICAGGFPVTTSSGFPWVPYGAVPANVDGAAYASFEANHLAPRRARALYEINYPGLSEQTVGGYEIAAYTPSGLKLEMSQEGMAWSSLTLALTTEGAPAITISNPTAALRASLVSSQLFLVIDKPTALALGDSLNFSNVTLEGWTFVLDPQHWRTDTVMLLKLAPTPLQALVDDMSKWSPLPSTVQTSPATQGVLQAAINQAIKNADTPEFQYFNNIILGDWTGVLFINAPIPAADFPAGLQALTASIDASEFKAHHLGADLSPVLLVGNQLSSPGSLYYGLIFYEDTTDLTYQGAAYAYKTLWLRVLFSGSQIASFASRIELLVAELFGETSTLEKSNDGDNLLLDGTWQRHDGQDVYSFSTSGRSRFVMKSQVLSSVTVNMADFVTLPDQDGQVCARFALSGVLAFCNIGDPDIMSFGPVSSSDNQDINGGLSFTNLYITLRFALGQPLTLVFAFEASQMVLDPNSAARAGSIYTRFPLRVDAMLQGTADIHPTDLGYIPTGLQPLHTSNLGDVWFGLDMTLIMGNAGALANELGLNARILAAWSPGGPSPIIAAGMRLPGAIGAREISLEGPIGLEIGDLTLIYDRQADYLLRMSNIVVKLLGMKWPEGGAMHMLLFGDPRLEGQRTLGWYASYLKDDSNDDSPVSINGRFSLAAKRRRRRLA